MFDMPLYLCPDCSRHYIRGSRQGIDGDIYLDKEIVTARVLRGDEVVPGFSCRGCLDKMVNATLGQYIDYYESLARPAGTIPT